MEETGGKMTVEIEHDMTADEQHDLMRDVYSDQVYEWCIELTNYFCNKPYFKNNTRLIEHVFKHLCYLSNVKGSIIWNGTNEPKTEYKTVEVIHNEQNVRQSVKVSKIQN